jgi:CubicO group peptidase (beta-lactamase class C family)
MVAERATTYPAAHWQRVTHRGWSVAKLAQVRGYFQRMGSTALMVVQDGQAVIDWGDTARKAPIASIRKSLLSALYGIAVADGRIKLGTTLAELGIDDRLPLTDGEKQATVADLLTTRSGVYHPVDSQPVGLAGPVPARGSHPPGAQFYYNNWDFNVLGTIYRQLVSESIYDAFNRLIAGPIGLEDFAISKDCAWGAGEISKHRNYGFVMSARDLARFGLLYARGGRWNGRQIVPANWVAESTRTHTIVRSQTFAGRGYGYMWWTGFGSDFAPMVTLPADSFHALGIGAQYVFVIPSHDLVIVHTVDMTQAKWPQIDDFQIGRLLWLILSAASIKDVGPDPSPAARGRVLEGDALHAALAGKTLRFADEALDGPYFIKLAADGAASLAKGPERRPVYTGKWRIDGQKLCRGWNQDLPRYDCFLAGVDGNTVSLYQDHDTMYLQAVIVPE